MKVKKSGGGIRRFGSAGGAKIGGGANKKGGALVATPAKASLSTRK